MLTEAIARKLGIEPGHLERESLRTYLKARRREVEAQLFALTAKQGVRTVQEFDAAIQQGKIREAVGFEDYFTFDHLEAERDKLVGVLASLT